MEFPRPRTYVPGLEPVIEAWALTSFTHDRLPPGASDKIIADAEDNLGRSLPDALRAIYEMSDGADLIGGNLGFYSLFKPRDDWFGVAEFRSWQEGQYLAIEDFVFPDELVVFANNGGDEEFGLWIPRGVHEDYVPPVVAIGEGGYTDLLDVAGTDICKFLRAWTTFHTKSHMDTMRSYADRGIVYREIDLNTIDLDAIELRVMEKLDVPDRIREMEVDDDAFEAIFRWADSDLPHACPDPYERRFSVNLLREKYGATRV